MGKTLTLPCLSTGTWQSWSIVIWFRTDKKCGRNGRMDAAKTISLRLRRGITTTFYLCAILHILLDDIYLKNLELRSLKHFKLSKYSKRRLNVSSIEIFKCPELPHLSTDFDETDIKIHGLLSSFL